MGGVLDLTNVEFISDYEGLMNVWGALFGRSEPPVVSSICLQYWQYDWHFQLSPGSRGLNLAGGSSERSKAFSRRAIVDVPRSRFPIQLSPLLTMLRAMTGSGFLDTDPLGSANDALGIEEQREACANYVYHFFRAMPTYTQKIPLAQCSGPHAIYEKSATTSGSTTGGGAGMTYTNLRPLWLPGGTLLPTKSTGTVMSGEIDDCIVVSWKHEHSGWRLMLEILNWYVNKRNMQFSTGTSTSVFPMPDIPILATTRRSGHHHSHHNVQPLQLKFEDIGMEISAANDEVVVTEALDLLRSVIQSRPESTDPLMASLEPQIPANTSASAPPDLVQLTTMVLEEALSRSGNRMTRDATANGGPRSSTLR